MHSVFSRPIFSFILPCSSASTPPHQPSSSSSFADCRDRMPLPRRLLTASIARVLIELYRSLAAPSTETLVLAPPPTYPQAPSLRLSHVCHLLVHRERCAPP
eukprot:673207-Hanusia_phi.AAC.3